jgi:hypothetical protein
MLTIPLADVPSQVVSASLGGQSVRMRLFTRRSGLYLDLYVANTLVLAGARCMDAVPIVRDAYLGFVGDLMFIDSQGSDAPSSPGLGTRFSLVYAEAADLGAVS